MIWADLHFVLIPLRYGTQVDKLNMSHLNQQAN